MKIRSVLAVFTAFIGIAVAVAISAQSAEAEPIAPGSGESESYRAYLGVVPASLIRRKPVLVDGNKDLHGGIDQSGFTQHVMVAVYRKQGNKRVEEATIIAKVSPKKLLGGSVQEKPLERMATTGGITYGNYFTMPQAGTYEIELKIYEPNRSEKEELTILYDRP